METTMDLQYGLVILATKNGGRRPEWQFIACTSLVDLRQCIQQQKDKWRMHRMIGVCSNGDTLMVDNDTDDSLWLTEWKMDAHEEIKNI